MQSTETAPSASVGGNRSIILTVGHCTTRIVSTQTANLGNAAVARLPVLSSDDTTARSRLLMHVKGYDTAVLAAGGTSALEALSLAARFPEAIQGLILFEPRLAETARQNLVHRIGAAVRRGLRRLSARAISEITGTHTPSKIGPGHFERELAAVTQPVLIFSPQSRTPEDFEVAATLQQGLGGAVEVRYVGPAAEIAPLGAWSPAIERTCIEFAARISSGAEGRRLKRQQSNANTVTRPIPAALRTPPPGGPLPMRGVPERNSAMPLQHSAPPPRHPLPPRDRLPDASAAMV